MKMNLFVLLQVLMMMFASDENDDVENCTKSAERMESYKAEQSFVVKNGEEKYPKENKRGASKHIGAIYKESCSKWEAHRWSNYEKKLVYSGYYKDEETAAHASDTLARKLIANGEKGHKLNFPDDDNEVYREDLEETTSSIYIGVSYQTKVKVWRASRHSKNKKKTIYNGDYEDEEIAASASDTLARKLMANGEQSHKLNFPDDHTEVYAKGNSTFKYIGVSYNVSRSAWGALRRSKREKKIVYNGTYKDKETAAHASDTLARELIANGEKNHRLNFPEDHTEVHREKRVPVNYIGVHYNEIPATWCAWRWSKKQYKIVYNGTYKNEITAACASDTLGRKLKKNGEKGHKLNFPDGNTEVYTEKKTNCIGVSYSQKEARWRAQRWSKNEKKTVYNGCNYKNERTAAFASDTLARKLMANAEKGHKLNFSDDNSEVYTNESKYQKKRKRQNNSGNSQDKKYYQI